MPTIVPPKRHGIDKDLKTRKNVHLPTELLEQIVGDLGVFTNQDVYNLRSVC